MREGGAGRFPWMWLAAGFLVLMGLTVWGIVVYPHLPDRVPQHMGSDGVDAWADKSIGSVFVPVFAHAGILLVLSLTTLLTLRVTPSSELPPDRPGSPLVNRPATRAGAELAAKAQLFLACCVGVGLAGACTQMWSQDPESVSGGLTLPLTLVPIAVGTLAVLGAAFKDKRDGNRRAG